MVKKSIQAIIFSLLFVSIYSKAYAQDNIYDPIESVNRGIFSFNDTLDVHILEPVAQSYEDNIPDSVQTGIGNFFDNLKFPKYFVSDLVQLKFSQALDHTGRFLINSTIGVLGVMDIAKDYGLPRHVEDFGIALAYHGVGPGPYLVLPFLGPSNVRDGFGLLVDTFLDPFTILSYSNVRDNIKIPIIVGAKVVQVVNDRAGLLEAIKTGKESSVDFYFFMQSAYFQYRRGLLYDGNPPDEDDVISKDAQESYNHGDVPRNKNKKD